MYGYQSSPAGTAYQQHPMNVLSTSSLAGQGYSMQPLYPVNGHSARPQTQTYMASPGMAVMGQAMQQPHYSMSHAQYQPQPLPFQSHPPNPQSLSQLLVNQQYQAQQPQPQQYMHPQAVQAYQMDGAPSYSHSGMRQPQGNPIQHAPSSQQRPRHQSNPNHTTTTGASPRAPSISNTPSRPQQQTQPKPQENHARIPSQSHPQPIASPLQPQVRTPSQPQPRATPQTHKHAMSPPQPQSRHQPSSNSQTRPASHQRPAAQMRSPQVVIETRRPSSQKEPTPVPSRTPAPLPRESAIDLQPVLLGLADQYISKAHGMSSYLARAPQEADIDQYYSLISAGLGCMESVLNNWKFSDPKAEARLQLRYANLLLEETENDGELQDLLTKGIALCERNRLVDLKYSMKHVQARSLFRTHPRSAFKMIDQMIDLTETYAHYSWVYVFRFLRVSFSLQLSHPDLSAALQHLRRISQQAEKQRQYPILTTCSALEALVHLRSGQADSADNFQRSLAAARTHQLNREVTDISQVATLLDCLDLCSDLVSGKPDQLFDKMNVMQKALDGGKRNTSPDGSFCVPTADFAPDDVSLDTCGIMERTADGKRAIVFQWLRRSELFALGYIFSSLASSSRNAVDHKSEKYLIEGDKLTQNDYNPENERKVQLCLQLLASLKCERADWQGAQEVLSQLTEGVKAEDVDEQDFVQVSALYLTGTVKQATGDLQGALECYKSPTLTLQAGQKTMTNQDLRILATLNTILILRPRLEFQDHVKHLMDLAEPLCEAHPNSNYRSAMYMVRASSINGLPVLKMKHYLSLSANIAKKQQNVLLLCVAINLMTSSFFVNIIGEKAELSAGSGKRLADRVQVPLWQAVASQLLGNTLNFGGKRAEGNEARVEAQRWMQMVPESIQEKFEVRS
ncbi:hypothetical protein KCU60_g12312, partial [Aureobasidium melanogenum]